MHFIAALKTVHRYVIDKLDDHWADLVDTHLGISVLERDKILDYGPDKFNTIIKARLSGISSIFQAYKKVKTLLPTEPESKGNSWLLQNAFYNNNFNRKHPNDNTTVHLTPGFYGTPEGNHTLSVEELFPRGIFISKELLEEKIEPRMVLLSYNNLKNHVKSKIGQFHSGASRGKGHTPP